MKPMKCWEVFKCNKIQCPAYESNDLKCWLFSETQCRDSIQGQFLEKIEMCLDCEMLKANKDINAMKATIKVVNKQFKEFSRMIVERDKELESMSMELALSMSEVFEALKKISSGDPTVRISEYSNIELIRKLKKLINLTASEIGEIVDQSHEIAIGLAEHFDVLHKVSTGNLNARVKGTSKVELLESLKRVTNETIENIYKEIIKRREVENALQLAYDELDQRVKERTMELTLANEKLQQEILDRKRAEDALRQSEEHHRTLIETMSEGLAIIDKNSIITFVNEQFCKMTGYSKEELIGYQITVLFDKENQKIFQKHWSSRMQGDSAPYEITITGKNEKKLYTLVSPRPIFDENKNFNGSFGVFTDITARKIAEKELISYQEQLRTLSSELSLVEERQRRCIASELHDYIGQTLFYCKNKLETLRESKSYDKSKELTDELIDLINQTMEYTKSLTFQLGTPILYEEGLEPALKWLGYQFQKQLGLIFRFEDDLRPKPISDETRILLYQAVRELMINVARHAKAKNVKISINRDYKNMQIQVEDDGIGVDTFKINPYTNKKEGFGLFTIHERIKYLGGHFKFDSKPGFGTKATIIVPLKPLKKVA